MKYLIIISFLFSNIHLFAQETKKVILKDTIHLKGYVKYLDGTPAKYIMVNSKEFYENIYSKTDENGYFEINPFKPSDTLIVDHHKFPINGSRFISLTIPKFEKKLETSLIITKRLKSEVSVIPVIIPVEPSVSPVLSVAAEKVPEAVQIHPGEPAAATSDFQIFAPCTHVPVVGTEAA
ncbi:MAG: hypothetical protein KJ712_05355 [Bacteroidetes bacterium]|nr:hypothetical protein [Bacteroidota bacterium]